MMEPTKHTYENMPAEDYDHDNDESLSNTQVDDSLMGDDKLWSEKDLRPRTRRNKFYSILRSCRWMIDTSLLLIILGFIVREQWRTPEVNEWQIGGDMTGVGPKCKYLLPSWRHQTGHVTFRLPRGGGQRKEADEVENSLAAGYDIQDGPVIRPVQHL